MGQVTEQEHKALAAISTVRRVAEHNALHGGESSVMQQARGSALRLGHKPGTLGYVEFISGCLEIAVKNYESPNPDVRHGWFMVRVLLDGGINAEAHYDLDADGDVSQIEVWSKGQDLWPLLSDDMQALINREIESRTPALLRRERAEAEEAEEARAGL